MQNQNRNEAMTGLEMIIAIAILCIFIYLSGSVVFNAIMPNFGGNQQNPGGVVGFAAGETQNLLMTDGTIYGAQNTGGVFLNVNLKTKDGKSTDLGSCAIPLKLFMGQTVSVDMNKAKIIFSYNGITEELSYSEENPLTSPSWTVGDKSSIIPLGSADNDVILEPNEIFTIIVYPQTNVPPYGKFSVTVTPEAEMPYVIDLSVPPNITEQRIVELYA